MVALLITTEALLLATVSAKTNRQPVESVIEQLNIPAESAEISSVEAPFDQLNVYAEAPPDTLRSIDPLPSPQVSSFTVDTADKPFAVLLTW